MRDEQQARFLAEQAVEQAVAAGADAADAIYAGGRSTSVQVRNGELEDVKRSEHEAVGVRLFVGQRSATASTSDFASEALGELVARALEMAREAPEDSYAGLAPAELLAGGPHPDIDGWDAHEPDMAAMQARVLEAEAAALGVTGVANSMGCGASASASVIGLATSHGFSGGYRSTGHSLSASVVADHGLDAEVTGREKHPFSIWKKMAERHISFEQLSDVMAFRVIVDKVEDCYRALGHIHERWPMVPGRFKDFISTPKRNGYRSLHTSVIHDSKMRIEVQIRSRDMHAQAERGLAAHWAYKEGKPAADLHVPWVDELVEILEHADSPEELLEHTRMAMYQDRIFAFTPKGELIQLPKGATPVDFAYAVHTDLGDRTVGAKVNGRVVPLRTLLDNGDQVEILASEAQHPQPSWLRFVATGKARSSIRRFVRHKERDETIELGRKIYDEIVGRLPAPLAGEALGRAVKKFKLEDSEALMMAIARKRIRDEEVMEALMPGSAGGDTARRPPAQRQAISIKGLTPGVAFHLADCCHPIPGDRIVGLRREDESIEVHVIGCDRLASGIDADWLDLAWGDESEGGRARLCVILRDVAGALGEMAGMMGAQRANIVNLALVHRDGSFHTFHLAVCGMTNGRSRFLSS